MQTVLNSFLDQVGQKEGFEKAKMMQLYEDTNSETVLKILARYHETLVESIQKIETALVSNDNESIWRAMHKIAGSAELLGFVSYGHEARNLSHEIKDSSIHPTSNKKISEFLVKTKKIKSLIFKSFPSLNNFLI